MLKSHKIKHGYKLMNSNKTFAYILYYDNDRRITIRRAKNKLPIFKVLSAYISLAISALAITFSFISLML